jgi:adenylate kinase
MLRAAVNAGTPVGLRAKDIMARGELVPDDVVVAIVADRIQQPDASRGFILDGFPRTVPQAHALDRMLAEKGMKLDAVIELKVDEDILVERMKTRVEQMKARGETPRADDDPEVLHRRLIAYRDQTAPLSGYFQLQSVLRSVDGMAAIEKVAEAIDQVLAPPAKARKAKTSARKKVKAAGGRNAAAKAPAKAPGTSPEKAPGKRSSGKVKRAASAERRSGAKTGRKGAKKAAKKAKQAGRSAKKAAPRKKAPPKQFRRRRLTNHR